MKDFWSTLAEATEGLHADKLKALAGKRLKAFVALGVFCSR